MTDLPVSKTHKLFSFTAVYNRNDSEEGLFGDTYTARSAKEAEELLVAEMAIHAGRTYEDQEDCIETTDRTAGNTFLMHAVCGELADYVTRTTGHEWLSLPEELRGLLTRAFYTCHPAPDDEYSRASVLISALSDHFKAPIAGAAIKHVLLTNNLPGDRTAPEDEQALEALIERNGLPDIQTQLMNAAFFIEEGGVAGASSLSPSQTVSGF